MALGQLQIDLPASDGLKKWNATIPHMLDFPFRKPLYSVANINNIHSFLLRLLFTMPVEMVELTIIDPDKMGQSIEDFFPLLDVGKLVPQKRCLTHPDKIEKGLLDLVDYTAELLQTRLRGKDWRTYNKENQDTPLPYKVLLMFDYPEQISSKSATCLKRILENGIKCGILPLIWITEEGLQQVESRVTPADRGLADIMGILAKQGQHFGQYSDEDVNALFGCPLKLKALDVRFRHEFYPKENLPQYLDWIAEAYSTHIEFKKTSRTIEGM